MDYHEFNFNVIQGNIRNTNSLNKLEIQSTKIVYFLIFILSRLFLCTFKSTCNYDHMIYTYLDFT